MIPVAAGARDFWESFEMEESMMSTLRNMGMGRTVRRVLGFISGAAVLGFALTAFAYNRRAVTQRPPHRHHLLSSVAACRRSMGPRRLICSPRR